MSIGHGLNARSLIEVDVYHVAIDAQRLSNPRSHRVDDAIPICIRKKADLFFFSS